jgi:FtsX-like permease family
MVTRRALRAHLGQSLALFSIGVLAVAGCVVAAGYARATHTSAGSAAALLLLGGTAVAVQGAASVQARRFEIALLQLRGGQGLRLLRGAVAEPAVILVVAAVVGALLGWVAARAAVHRWLGPRTSFAMTAYEWSTAGLVLMVSLLVVVAVSWRTTYEPLLSKLDNLQRPRGATATGVFLSLLVLIGAVVSVYQARSFGVRHADWVSYLSPALLGLAAGQVGIWLVSLLARATTSAGALDRRLGWFLTLRRLARRATSVALLRIVVAAVVVAGIAASAQLGSAAWREQTARVEVGGPVSFAVAGGGLRAYTASHRADPRGRWLMAMAASPDPTGGSYRDAFVDSPRWHRVVGGFFAGTPIAAVSDRIGVLAPRQVVRVVSGRRFSVAFSARTAARTLPGARQRRHLAQLPSYLQSPALQFTVTYVDGTGNEQLLQVPTTLLRLPARVDPGEVGYSARIRGCDLGCAVEGVAVQGRTRHGPLRITGMSIGKSSLLPGGPAGMVLRRSARVRAVAGGGLDLVLRASYKPFPLLSWGPVPAAPALATPGLRLQHVGGHPQAYGIDGQPRPVDVRGQVPALPLLGRAGLLLDLGSALRGAGGKIPVTRTRIVARADTPPAVLRRLRATGAVGARRTVAQTLAAIQRSGTAQATTLYALVAAFGLAIAAVAVVSATVEQRRSRRLEAASLRVVGVEIEEVAGAYRNEAAVLGAAVAVVAGAAVWLGCQELLGVLPLADPGQFGLPFDATPAAGVVAGLALVAGAFVALVVFAGLRLVGRSSPPILLREEP